MQMDRDGAARGGQRDRQAAGMVVVSMAQRDGLHGAEIHAEGLGGVFPNPTQLDELVALVRGFGEPLQPPAAN